VPELSKYKFGGGEAHRAQAYQRVFRVHFACISRERTETLHEASSYLLSGVSPPAKFTAVAESNFRSQSGRTIFPLPPFGLPRGISLRATDLPRRVAKQTRTRQDTPPEIISFASPPANPSPVQVFAPTLPQLLHFRRLAQLRPCASL
jgi:hypothetical protein